MEAAENIFISIRNLMSEQGVEVAYEALVKLDRSIEEFLTNLRRLGWQPDTDSQCVIDVALVDIHAQVEALLT